MRKTALWVVGALSLLVGGCAVYDDYPYGYSSGPAYYGYYGGYYRPYYRGYYAAPGWRGGHEHFEHERHEAWEHRHRF